MPKLVWDEAGKHFYETGVDHGVLSVIGADGTNGTPVVWNGLTSVTESPSGAEESKIYADNVKYLGLRSAEDLGGTIECYVYPDEFEACDGVKEFGKGVTIIQQTRSAFNLAFRTVLGNDTAGNDYGYKLHLIYNATANPSEKAHSTINDSPEATTLSYEFTTTPIQVSGFKPTSELIIDSTKVGAGVMAKIEDLLYGTKAAEPKFPTPAEILPLLTAI